MEGVWKTPPQPLLHAYGGSYHLLSPAEVREYVTAILQEAQIPTEGNPDVTFFEADEVGVSLSREILQAATIAPVGSRRVIVVIAARITRAAQDALLKLFEEPPAKTTLFLFLPDISMLLPTLRSRLFLLPEPHIAIPEELKTFANATYQKRQSLIKQLAAEKNHQHAWRFIDGLLHAAQQQPLAWKRKHQHTLQEVLVTYRYWRLSTQFPRQFLEVLALVFPAFEDH